MDIIKAREELIFGKTIYDMNLKVADYGRVSTDKDEQINSLENQKSFFREYIESVKKWRHVNSYIDEGISGTQVNKRDQFLKMIEDAKDGKIDLILTKEVSRFARNTIDSIKYTEILLSYGVIVFFITDNINTIYKDSEFRLTLMASMAQDEVRKLSERVKFGIKRSIKDGKVGGGGIFGYNKQNSKLTINKEEAKVVKMVYSLYSSGEYGLKSIGELLKEEGFFTRKGKVFSDVTLKKMIKNPKYKGWYTANLSEVIDYKTHKRIYKDEKEWILYKDNSGKVPQIVSEKIWEKANKILKERSSKKNKINNKKYTSKIRCFIHNKSYIRCASGKRRNNPVWQCDMYLRKGLNGCQNKRLFEKNLDDIIYKILKDILDKNKILKDLLNDYYKICDEKVFKIIKRRLDNIFNIKNNIELFFDTFIKQVIVNESNLRIIFNYEKDDLLVSLN